MSQRHLKPISKPVAWMPAALKDLKEFPAKVQRSMGYALDMAQRGEKSDYAKPLHGSDFPGAGVLEIVQDFQTDTYRAVYTVRYAEAIYVLHCFQKKAKKGIATPKADMDLIKQRWRQVEQGRKEKGLH